MAVWDKVKTDHGGKPPLITIYAPEGQGKTTLACGAPNPIVLAVEDGIGRQPGLQNIPAITSADLATYDALRTTLWEVINDPRDRKTIVIDSADQAEALMGAHVCKNYTMKDGTNPTEVREIPYGAGQGMLLSVWHEFWGLLKIAQDKGLMVILICHAHAAKIDPPDQLQSYQRFDLKLSKDSAAFVREQSEAVLFLTTPLITASVAGDFDKTKTKIKVRGQGERRLYTSGNASHFAKTRWSNMPEYILIPPIGGWAALAQHLTGVPTV